MEKHIVTSLSDLLGDDHALRQLFNIEDAGQLSTMFKEAKLRKTELGNLATREAVMRSIGQAIQIKKDRIEILIHPRTMGIAVESPLRWSMPLPSRKPFREAKLRIDKEGGQPMPDQQLIQLLIDAAEAKRLVLCCPELSLNKLYTREGRCRTQLAKLLRLSWLSPRIVETILSGTQPSSLTRAQLLNCELPLDWTAQERLLGFAR